MYITIAHNAYPANDLSGSVLKRMWSIWGFTGRNPETHENKHTLQAKEWGRVTVIHRNTRTHNILLVWLYSTIWLIMWSSDPSWVAAQCRAQQQQRLHAYSTITLLSLGPYMCVKKCVCAFPWEAVAHNIAFCGILTTHYTGTLSLKTVIFLRPFNFKPT